MSRLPGAHCCDTAVPHRTDKLAIGFNRCINCNYQSPKTECITSNICALADLGGGGVPGARPLWDPILSFSHTFSPKSAHVGGPRPPLTGARPPTGNPGSATAVT